VPAWLESTISFFIILTIIVGQLGLIIPIFPGNVIIWVATLVYGIVFGFGQLGAILFAIITLLTIVAVTADNILMGAKAKEKGAAWNSIILALASAVVFTMIFPPIGGIIAAPLVLYLMEFRRLNDSKQASEIVKALILGLGLSFVARFALGLLMIGLWGAWSYWG
jgi:uncharacterized protein